jgi:hypothetical protein
MGNSPNGPPEENEIYLSLAGVNRGQQRKFSADLQYFFTFVFRHENSFQKVLHNETAFAIQRRLQYSGITTVIMPVRAEK